MIHEILEIKNNRVDIKHVENISDDMKEVVLSCEDDKFYK